MANLAKASPRTTRSRGRRLLMGLSLMAGLAWLLGLKANLEAGLPDKLELRGHRNGGVTRILASDGRLVATLFRERRKPLPLESIGRNVVDALISVEDRRFREHQGVDWTGVARAALGNARSGRVEEGASTLTMQLARHLYLDDERNWKRKAQEALLARRLESAFGKDEILASYLNEMYFGGGSYGVGAASSWLFNKTPDQLSTAQAALMIGLLQSPTYLNPALNADGAKARGKAVLVCMRDSGALAEGSYRRATVELDKMAFGQLAERDTPMLKYPYFTSFAISRLAQEVGERNLYSQALTVRTTLDIRAQRAAERILREAIVHEGAAARADAGAVVVVENKSGAIVAMAGGAGWTGQDQFNRAWQARRQAGSTFKPFVYAAALEQGYQPFSLVMDRPLSAGAANGWMPVNADGRGQGLIPLRQALAQSRNQATAQLMSDLGPPALTDLCERFGFLSELPEVPSLALGSGAVTPLEMATAYSVFANEGWLVESHPVLEATTSAGRRLVDHRHPWISQSTSPAVAAQMTDLLMDAVSGGTGSQAGLPGTSVAGKTGTTDSHRDAWFVGYTPAYTVAVWMGNDDNSPTDGLYGGQAPARVFRRVMAALNQPEARFASLEQEPNYVSLCARSRQMASQDCPRTTMTSTYLPLSEGDVCESCAQRFPTEVQIVDLGDPSEVLPGQYAYELSLVP